MSWHWLGGWPRARLGGAWYPRLALGCACLCSHNGLCGCGAILQALLSGCWTRAGGPAGACGQLPQTLRQVSLETSRCPFYFRNEGTITRGLSLFSRNKTTRSDWPPPETMSACCALWVGGHILVWKCPSRSSDRRPADHPPRLNSCSCYCFKNNSY